MSKMAIAYAMKKKKKKMAMGGDVETEKEGFLNKVKNWASPAPSSAGPKIDSDFAKKVAAGIQGKAHGGFIEQEKASGFVKHPGNDVKHNGPAISEEAKKLNQLKNIIMDSDKESTVDGVMDKESQDFSGLDRYAMGGDVAGTLSKVNYHNDEQGLVDRIMYKHSKDFSDLDRYADGGAVGGAKTSTTGNKTKTGGSNPGGASTGGAGTVTITTGKLPPNGINVSGVGGTTESRNAGGMDPSDEEDAMMMSKGGKVANDVGTGQEADKDPNQFDDLVLRDDLESTYGVYDNAGDDHGNAQEDEDRRDIVSRIMASRRKKDKLPSPA